MTRIHHRLLVLALSFVVLLAAFLVKPVQANTRDMVENMHRVLENAHRTAGKDWQIWGSPEPEPNLSARALKLAQDQERGAAYLGSDKPLIERIPRWHGVLDKKIYGPTEHYFYTIVRPTDQVDQNLLRFLTDGRGNSRLAVFLWKHIPGKTEPQNVAMEIIHDTGFDWSNQFQKYAEVIARTR